MYVSQAILAKVPLDREYKNVFDFSNEHSDYKEEYKTNILLLYPNDVYFIYDNSRGEEPQKSVNINDKISLTFNFDFSDYSIYDIRNYNYLMLSVRDEFNLSNWYFYFITEVTMKNGIGAISFECEYDSWANNIDKIMLEDFNNFIERRNINDYVINNNQAEARNYISDEENCRIEQTFSDENHPLYSVLYLRLWLDNETILKNSSLVGDTTSYGVIPSLNPLQIIYVPVSLIYTKTRETVTSCLNYVVRDVGGQAHTYPLPLTQNGTIQREYNSHVLYSDFTFLYNISAIYNEGDDYFEFLTDPFEMPEIYRVFGGAYIGEQSDPFVNGFVRPTNLHSIFDEYDISYSVNKNDFSQEDNSLEKRHLLEPRMHYYPYNYSSIKCGNENIDFIPVRDAKKILLRYQYANSVVPKIKYYYDNDQVSSKFLYFSNYGSNPVVNDSLSEFLRNNSGQITASIINNRISSGINSISAHFNNEPNTNTSGLQNKISILGKIIDQDSKQDSLNMPSTYANADFMFQDGIVVMRNYMASNVDIERITNYITNFGINYQNFGKISENTRKNFDYIKTRDCCLNYIYNQKDREVIKNIFNNGVRKWHMDTCYSQAIKAFDTNYLNLPINF